MANVDPDLTKLCKDCGPNPIGNFGKRSDGYLRTYCKKCHNNRCYQNSRKKTVSPERRERDNRKQRENRKKPENVPRYILKDTKSSDKKKGRSNDLDIEFVSTLISKGCTYCGEIQLRMTLDRKDNSKGHTKENVLPACIRCNYVRGAMPYKAWLQLVPGMKKARINGLFGEWTGRAR